MKKLIITTLLLQTILSFGQTDCKNNVSTDYLNSSNNNLPNGVFNGVNIAPNYLNGFNWVPRNGTTLIQYSPSNIVFDNSPIVMKNIMSPSIPEYAYLYGQGVKEPLIIDGWELLLVNLGYYPDNVTIIPAAADDNIAFPYIVLYNRYSGIIRVYTNFGTDSDAGQGGNAMTITVGFESDNVGPFRGRYLLCNGF